MSAQEQNIPSESTINESLRALSEYMKSVVKESVANDIAALEARLLLAIAGVNKRLDVLERQVLSMTIHEDMAEKVLEDRPSSVSVAKRTISPPVRTVNLPRCAYETLLMTELNKCRALFVSSYRFPRPTSMNVPQQYWSTHLKKQDDYVAWLEYINKTLTGVRLVNEYTHACPRRLPITARYIEYYSGEDFLGFVAITANGVDIIGLK